MVSPRAMALFFVDVGPVANLRCFPDFSTRFLKVYVRFPLSSVTKVVCDHVRVGYGGPLKVGTMRTRGSIG